MGEDPAHLYIHLRSSKQQWSWLQILGNLLYEGPFSKSRQKDFVAPVESFQNLTRVIFNSTQKYVILFTFNIS